MWWDHGPGWGGWIMMAIGMSGFWVAVSVLVVALLRTNLPAPSRGPDAREILQQRLARGEIDTQEYRARLDTLRGVGD